MVRIAHKGRLAIVLVIPVLLYWGFVPLFWPLPELAVRMPTETSIDEAVPIDITLESWHPNFEVIQVRFYVDHYHSDVHGPEGTFYPQVLHQNESPVEWGYWDVSRVTWPRERKMKVELPLLELAREGVVKPGTVRGKIDVTLVYPDMHSRMVRLLGEYPKRSRMISQPFELRILPAPSQ